GSEFPFLAGTVLKEATAFKVMLTKCSRKILYTSFDQGIASFEFAKGEMKCLFVSVKVLVVKISIFVEPTRQTKWLPTPLLVEHHLAALEFRFARQVQTTTPPDGAGRSRRGHWPVRPENRPRFAKLRCIKQIFRVADGDVIRIQKKQLPEARMQDGIGFESPAFDSAGGADSSFLSGVDTFIAHTLDERFHGLVRLF